MSRVNEAVYGCNLQTGTLLLLWLFAIFCGFSAVLDIYHISEDAQPWSKEISWFGFKFIIAFLYKLGVFTATIIGLYGIHRNKPQIFVIFYYFNYIQLLLISFFIVYLFLDPVEHSKNLVPLPETKLIIEDQNRTLILSLLLLLGLAFQTYFILVMRTYYETMKERCSPEICIIMFANPQHYDYGLTYVR